MLGSANEANGSASTAASVVGAGLNVALPLLETPPCTSIAAALIAAFPLARMALDELESTYTPPVTLMSAFPAMLKAPPAVGSSTMIDWPIVIVLVVVLLVRKFVSPEYVTAIE